MARRRGATWVRLIAKDRHTDFWRSRQPGSSARRPWLHLLADEMPPVVLESDRPSRAVWPPLWATRPDSQIAFDLPAGSGRTNLRWTLLVEPTSVRGPSVPPHVSMHRHLDQRQAGLQVWTTDRQIKNRAMPGIHETPCGGNSSWNADKLMNQCRTAGALAASRRLG